MIAGRGASANVYDELLGPAFAALHPHVRDAHRSPLDAKGTIDVVHGSHWLTRLLVGLFSLPAAGSAQPTVVRVADEVSAAGHRQMRWSRLIGHSELQTRQSARRGLLVEQNGRGAVEFALREEQGALVYDQRSMRLLQIPLWSPLSPRIHARVSPAAVGWHVDVRVEWRGHLICRYAGSMSRVETRR